MGGGGEQLFSPRLSSQPFRKVEGERWVGLIDYCPPEKEFISPFGVAHYNIFQTSAVGSELLVCFDLKVISLAKRMFSNLIMHTYLFEAIVLLA